MSWWVWIFIVWPLGAAVVALVVGPTLKAIDRRYPLKREQ